VLHAQGDGRFTTF